MRKTLLSITAIILAILVVYFAYQINRSDIAANKKTVVLENGARLVWEDCWFDAPDYANCARLHTAPKDSNQASAFSLPVIVLRHRGFNHKKDPIIYIAGGPGSGAGLEKSQIEDYWLSWFDSSNAQRDLVLFDQRGTGLSEPALTCPKYNQAIRESFITDISSAEKAKKTRKALQDCHQKMIKEGIAIDQVSTLYSAGDVRDLMDTLDYPLWNIFGVSYGTRLAIVTEQKNPERVRSMVLDSVYPIKKHFFKEWPALLSSSLNKIFSYCNHQAACKRDYGNIETIFWETMAQLKEKPLKVKVTDHSLGLPEVIIDDETFIDFLFDSQYESGSLYDLPAVIDAFHNRDHEQLKDYVSGYLQSRLLDSVSEVVFRTVECKDNPALDPSDITKIYDQHPKLKPYLSSEYDDCNLWGNRNELMNIGELTKPSDIPVLILAGEDDPVTPIGWVTEVIDQYPESQFFSFPNTSHSVMDRKRCGIELFRQFIDEPSIRPTADCRNDSDY